jgi:3-oxoacyl-[acyl-carrier protein] reductase/pteridine reductase
MNSLDGKVVVVTGAARRIGRSIALELAASGAKVAVHYWTSEAEARDTAEQCRGRVFQADLTDVAAIERLFAAVRDTYGRLDGLVNNAARYRAMDVLRVTEQDWDALHSVNLKATFFCCQQAAKIMLESGGGRIVNISSMGGLRPWTRHVPYGASKAGVIMLTRSLAKALAPDITVNSVAPGVIHFDSEMPDDFARLVRATPMQRHGTGDDVAQAVVQFFTGPDFITGQVLTVDGGLSLK